MFSVPNIDSNTLNSKLPPGLTLIENFITEKQEETLLRTINWEEYGKTFKLIIQH